MSTIFQNSCGQNAMCPHHCPGEHTVTEAVACCWSQYSQYNCWTNLMLFVMAACQSHERRISEGNPYEHATKKKGSAFSAADGRDKETRQQGSARLHATWNIDVIARTTEAYPFLLTKISNPMTGVLSWLSWGSLPPMLAMHSRLHITTRTIASGFGNKEKRSFQRQYAIRRFFGWQGTPISYPGVRIRQCTSKSVWKNSCSLLWNYTYFWWDRLEEPNFPDIWISKGWTNELSQKLLWIHNSWTDGYITAITAEMWCFCNRMSAKVHCYVASRTHNDL